MTEPLEQLLVVQGHDLKVTQLRTRRSSLPERAELLEVDEARAALDERMAGVDAQRHRIERDQTRLDDEVASLRAKAEQADKALYGGGVTNAAELQALQEQVASLQRRIGELEDQELELMVARDPLDEEASAIAAEQAVLADRAEAIATRITVAEAEIDAELAQEASARTEAAAAVADDLLAEYEALRSQLGGVGVARLEHGTCQGCHMKLSAVELDRIKGLPADARVHCEDCGRILVR